MAELPPRHETDTPLAEQFLDAIDARFSEAIIEERIILSFVPNTPNTLELLDTSKVPDYLQQRRDVRDFIDENSRLFIQVTTEHPFVDEAEDPNAIVVIDQKLIIATPDQIGRTEDDKLASFFDGATTFQYDNGEIAKLTTLGGATATTHIEDPQIELLLHIISNSETASRLFVPNPAN